MRSANAAEGGNESHLEDNNMNSFSPICPDKIKFKKLLQDKKN